MLVVILIVSCFIIGLILGVFDIQLDFITYIGGIPIVFFLVGGIGLQILGGFSLLDLVLNRIIQWHIPFSLKVLGYIFSITQ